MTSIQDYQARDHLLTVLKLYKFPLNTDAISAKFASPECRDQLLAWIKEYLTHDTLLTEDELML